MATLQVREVPTAVYGVLAEAARHEHRSLAQQALITLERGLGLAEDPMERRQRVLRAIGETKIPEGKSLPDPVELVREDRAR